MILEISNRTMYFDEYDMAKLMYRFHVDQGIEKMLLVGMLDQRIMSNLQTAIERKIQSTWDDAVKVSHDEVITAWIDEAMRVTTLNVLQISELHEI